MGMPGNTPRTWRFGVFELDASSGELRRNGTVVKLREQPGRILLLLSRGTAVTLFGNQTTHFVHASVTPRLISQLCSLTQHQARCGSHNAHNKSCEMRWLQEIERKLGANAWSIDECCPTLDLRTGDR
ncbi:hypothetical protein [Edaphobacter modestus]|uniref:Uncharacterized protein n=1 Tax=Edaphobacter modestus TaxID=388466 RepID=A0A4Q7YZT5_9BACT|nr:hypothetical protein [Edaphobacter modestus]RZU43457.1 hypothetical protein BDD14_5121 [Edaphobacter modestus]